jgi:hypothetical protein
MEAAMAAMEAAADDVLASLSRAFCSTVAVFVQIQVSTFSALWWIVSCLWELYEAANGALLCYRGAILSGGEFCSPASWISGLRCWCNCIVVLEGFTVGHQFKRSFLDCCDCQMVVDKFDFYVLEAEKCFDTV